MSALLELAERCEKAAGPDRDLDMAICLALDTGRRVTASGQWLGPDEFTASLDAAMTLVPDGLTFGCGGWDSTGKPWAWVGRNKDPKDVLHLAEGGAIPALALCAAALRARAAEQVS